MSSIYLSFIYDAVNVKHSRPPPPPPAPPPFEKKVPKIGNITLTPAVVSEYNQLVSNTQVFV